MLSESAARALGWLTASLGGRPVPPLVIAIGLGDGGLLEALASIAPATRVLALEPDAQATFDPASARGTQWTASGRLLHLRAPDFAGADQAWRLFPQDPEQHHLFVHPESAVRARDLAVRAARVVQQVLVGVRANAEARRQFAAPYLMNTLGNVPAIIRGADVAALRGAYAGTPAVVVGAGPSLDAVMPALPSVAGRALVIATDTTLRPLLHAGVAPPLVAGLDPSTANARHFLALPELRHTWLVAESALAPSAVQPFGDRTFWFRAAAHHPWPFLTANGVQVSELPVWGSVLTAAFQVALLAGCDPIVFVGADLAFTGGQPYARGTTYEFDWAYSTALGAPLRHVWDQQMAMRECVPAVDLRGAPTVTSPALISFRDWIVAQAGRSGRRIVNASGQGILHGSGVECGDLRAVLGAGRLVRPLDELRAPRTCADPSGLETRLRALRDAVVTESSADVQAWAAFAGERYDAAAMTRTLDAIVADDRVAATPASSIPWPALPPALTSYAHLRQLPERIAARHTALNGGAPEVLALEEACIEVGRGLGALLSTLLPGLDAHHEDPAHPDARHDALGVPAVAGQRQWPPSLAWPMVLFESAVGAAPAAPPATTAFATGAVRLRDGEPGVAADHAPAARDVARAQRALVAAWLRTVASCAEVRVSDRGTLTRLQALLEAAAADDAVGMRTAAVLAVSLPDLPGGGAVAVPLSIDERPLARVLTGALVAVGEGAASWRDPGTVAVTLEAGEWQARIALERDSSHAGPATGSALCPAAFVAPVVLTERGVARSAFAYTTAEGAVCVGIHARESVLVRSDGSTRPHLTWPRPIIGELPYGDGGAVAWNNGTAAWPALGDGYVLYRATADGPVVEETLPFRPSNGAWWQGRLVWNTYPTGAGAWAPGEVPRHWLTAQAFAGVRPGADGVELQSCTLDEWGGYTRALAREGWRLDATGHAARVPLGPRGAATATATHASGWTATAHPQADVVTLCHPAAPAVDLTCYDPLGLAWAGEALLVCTGGGDVLLFADLVPRLPSR